MLLDLLLKGAIGLFVVWIAWYVLQYLATKFKLNWAQNITTSAVGSAFGKEIDVTEEFAAYQALTAIRSLPSVQASQTALQACDVLRTTITQWTKPVITTQAAVTTIGTTTAAQ